MPKFNSENHDQAVVPGTSFNFSYIKPENLGACEYTLVSIAVDTSYSVSLFKDDLLECLKAAIWACKKSPRSENLLVRLVSFNSSSAIKEIHGFTPLNSIDPDSYDSFSCGGMTALYDTLHSCIGATQAYAKNLTDMEFDINAITFTITDGDDNDSKQSNPLSIKNLVADIKQKEEMESIINVLIGINSKDGRLFGKLSLLKDEADLDQFVEVSDISAGKLAKLARFVSQSVSSASQALNSGGPSQLLTF